MWVLTTSAGWVAMVAATEAKACCEVAQWGTASLPVGGISPDEQLTLQGRVRI